MTLFVFFLTAAGAGIIATYLPERIALGFLGFMLAVRAMHMAVVVVVLMVVLAIRAVDVVVFLHGAYSGRT